MTFWATNWVLLSNKNSRDSEPRQNVVLYKLNYINLPNLGQRFSFDPFGEVICSSQQEFLISRSLEKYPPNVHSPLSERPWIGERGQIPSWLVNERRKKLILLALLDIQLGILLHIQPPISLC